MSLPMQFFRLDMWLVNLYFQYWIIEQLENLWLDIFPWIFDACYHLFLKCALSFRLIWEACYIMAKSFCNVHTILIDNYTWRVKLNEPSILTLQNFILEWLIIELYNCVWWSWTLRIRISTFFLTSWRRTRGRTASRLTFSWFNKPCKLF